MKEYFTPLHKWELESHGLAINEFYWLLLLVMLMCCLKLKICGIIKEGLKIETFLELCFYRWYTFIILLLVFVDGKFFNKYYELEADIALKYDTSATHYAYINNNNNTILNTHIRYNSCVKLNCTPVPFQFFFCLASSWCLTLCSLLNEHDIIWIEIITTSFNWHQPISSIWLLFLKADLASQLITKE